MNLFDSHTHTRVSPDSKASLAEMAQAAIAAGVHTLHITDHCDLLDYDGHPVTSFDWPAARAQYHAVKAQTEGRLALHLGIELGSITFAPEAARRIIAEGGEDLDFVLGSSHNWIGAHDNREMYFFDFSLPSLAREAVETYLAQARELVCHYPDCYDSLAHIVYPLRYIRRDGQDLSLDDYEDEIRDIFTRIAATDHALEFNTYQGKDLAIWLPLLRRFKECGGRFVTLGSDAHRPEDMAKGIPEAMELLRAAGFDRVTTFVRRQPVEHHIEAK